MLTRIGHCKCSQTSEYDNIIYSIGRLSKALFAFRQNKDDKAYLVTTGLAFTSAGNKTVCCYRFDSKYYIYANPADKQFAKLFEQCNQENTQ